MNRIAMGVSRYAIPTGIMCIDRLSMGPPSFGVSQVGIRA